MFLAEVLPMTFRVSMLAGLVVVVAAAWGYVPAQDQPKTAKLPPEVQPKRVSLPEKDMLRSALKKVQQQTGIEVVPDEEAELKFPAKLEQVPFWQALDTIAKTADMRVALYRPDGKLGLVKDRRGWREMPTSYDGMFRVVLKKMTINYDLEEDVRYGVAGLELAWEPRFQAFLLETHPADMVVEAGGVPLKLPPIAKGKAAAHQRSAMEINLPMPAVRRQIGKLDKIQGKLSIIGSPQMLNLTFDNIKQGEKKGGDGVTAVLSSVQMNKGIWTIDVSLTYPPDMPNFESFQSWLVNNECYLENKDKKRLENGGFESDNPAPNRAHIRYRFAEEDNLTLDKPTDWKLIYKTPARIVELSIPFEFKDVPLP